MAGLPTTKPEFDRSSLSGASADRMKDKDLENQPKAPGALSDSDSGEIGRQIELESDNSIKYRTCSWQKVCARSNSCGCDEKAPGNVLIVLMAVWSGRRPLCSSLSISVWL